LIQEISKHFPDLSDEQLNQFAQLQDLYKEWNDKINVVSRKDIDELMTRHVLHSLAIPLYYQFKPGTKILDVGTGGGFPGIPLAIMFPEVEFHLVDSIAKKIKVVNGVKNALGLKNVKAEQIRAENAVGPYDFIISRAVTRLNKFLPWVENHISKTSFNDMPNGMIFIKGGDLTEEIKEVKYKFKVHDISEKFKDEFFETKQILYCQKK
jgi:16S rRNA (guanine527-N7)-methyltransferase